MSMNQSFTQEPNSKHMGASASQQSAGKSGPPQQPIVGKYVAYEKEGHK